MFPHIHVFHSYTFHVAFLLLSSISSVRAEFCSEYMMLTVEMRKSLISPSYILGPFNVSSDCIRADWTVVSKIEWSLPDRLTCQTLLSQLWRNIGLKKSEKLSPSLSVVCTQHRSLAFCILRVDPEYPFIWVNECVSKYQNFGFRLKISMVD